MAYLCYTWVLNQPMRNRQPSNVKVTFNFNIYIVPMCGQTLRHNFDGARQGPGELILPTEGSCGSDPQGPVKF